VSQLKTIFSVHHIDATIQDRMKLQMKIKILGVLRCTHYFIVCHLAVF